MSESVFVLQRTATVHPLETAGLSGFSMEASVYDWLNFLKLSVAIPYWPTPYLNHRQN